MDASFFKKKFSVGLVLDTSITEFKDFLDKYNEYIDTIYFSLPLGDKFHGRPKIAQQFKDPSTVELFWRLLDIIPNYGIKLESVFNTNHLNGQDMYMAKNLLLQHKITPEKIAITDDLYDDAVRYFPESERIYSISNYGNIVEELKTSNKKYSEIVVGRDCLRNSKAYKTVERMNSKVLLVLNDGCSFTCGGRCSAHGAEATTYCKNCFENSIEKNSPEYVYALQSVMPFEIHEKFLDVDKIEYFKLSTRNSDVDYIQKCIESYVFNVQDPEDTTNYFLWARLGWFVPYYEHLDFQKIVEIKKSLYLGGKNE